MSHLIPAVVYEVSADFLIIQCRKSKYKNVENFLAGLQRSGDQYPNSVNLIPESIM